MNTNPYIRAERVNRRLLYVACVNVALAIDNGVTAWLYERWFNRVMCLVSLASFVFALAVWLGVHIRLRQQRMEFKMQRRGRFLFVQILRREGMECRVPRLRFKRHKKGNHASINDWPGAAANN